jgi:alkylation response protein AidB-like acyl-CoA dehydrogenase
MNISDRVQFGQKTSDVAIVPSYEDLVARFRPIFVRIAEGAVEREINRELPFKEIGWLRDAGFGKVRIPKIHGGLGATVPQFFRLLAELAEADSNISHALRGHFAFLEERVNLLDKQAIEFWFPKIAQGALIGYAMAEQTEETGTSTTLTAEGNGWVLDGIKYYSTGTIFADWIVVSVKDGEDFASVAVPADGPGVTRIDDWDGFGQRMTGSGTTKFERVPVRLEQILRRRSLDEKEDEAEDKLAGTDETHDEAKEKHDETYGLSFLQMILLTSIAGVGRAALRDVIAFVQPRTRGFGIPGKSSPRNDPLVQRVVGRISSLVFAAESIVENNANNLEVLYQARLSGNAQPADYVAANIKTFQAQQLVIDLVLQATTLLFEVGGASATSERRRLDRHWRNARTAASHNPAIYRERAIGDYLLNGTVPETRWSLQRSSKEAGPESSTTANEAGVATDSNEAAVTQIAEPAVQRHPLPFSQVSTT